MSREPIFNPRKPKGKGGAEIESGRWYDLGYLYANCEWEERWEELYRMVREWRKQSAENLAVWQQYRPELERSESGQWSALARVCREMERLHMPRLALLLRRFEL